MGDSTDVDFVNASEQELRETDFDVEDANAAMKEAFGKGLDKGKDPVDSIIDIRHRNNERTEQEKLIEEGKKARIDKKAKNKGKGKK
ncbi:MAG: hypothetical protein KAG66_02010 [Methylococcales bacterium]|nr:hypothetical protein [Methylococcales bacterium]